MVALRDGFDLVYDLIKSIIFKTTAKNPEIAHHLFVNSLKALKAFGLSGLVLNNEANRMNPGYKISNAAGFNKDGDIDPEVMELLGFDRVVIGTVTADPWKGNPKPRVWRYTKTGSLANWMGLPGIGARGVARNLEKYGYHGVPLTVNLMSTPEKSGKDVLLDLEKTVFTLRDLPYVDRFGLNISCPNTHGSDGKTDTGKGNLSQLDGMLDVVRNGMHSWQDLYLKVSPDSSEEFNDDIISFGKKYEVSGYTTANTTTVHDSKYIDVSPGKGGASGNAVWDVSVRTQKYFAERVGDAELIACGGINSVERAKERCTIGNCKEIQLFTGLIYEGTGLLRKLRAG